MKNLDAYQNADSKTGTEREIAGIARAAVFELRAKTDKRLETRKIKDCLNRDYCITVELAFVKRCMKPFANRGFCKKKPDTDFNTHRIKIGVRLWSG